MATTTNFIQRFQQTLHERQSLLCVGLDPDLQKLPAGLPRSAEGIISFCKEIIVATAAFASAFKVNFAFFEALGTAGWAALETVAQALPDDAVKIADAKRGDIGNTAQMYAEAIFRQLPFDAMTANPYLGEDAALPFLEDASKGVFFLCRTSNPGSSDIQNFPDRTRPLYLHIAAQVREWNKKGNAGLVVGATHPRELQEVRKVSPDLPFLIPGVGAQGGDLETAVRFGATASGDLAIINASRTILYADSGNKFAEAAARAAEKMRDAIRDILQKSPK
ncbi:MAG: orotidine-5'-phosphate decarboxylase [candidate division KSB1 bacterium]|nr:orotidine-5'-phosphate decarboxylase [candidate division KSB1 bacterium]MDZ7304949.1 orotidine-5'-phosphate decarboxylase [candidate division KSB1 bacterium]MDZ7314018.1 orotidine-5'-phosphate decarboxylase [candidate division KSB1 bacterium]